MAKDEQAECEGCAASHRLAAARLCRSAFYLAVGSAVVHLAGSGMPAPLTVPLSAVAVVLALLGLGKLGVADRGPPADASHPGRERYAARRVRAAPREAWLAIFVGAGVCVSTVVLFALASR